jgi:hypothetical protein
MCVKLNIKIQSKDGNTFTDLSLAFIPFFSIDGLKNRVQSKKWFAQGGALMSRAERCRNPWNGECKSTDIHLYIMFKGRQLPICRRCWSKIADKRLEWSGEAERVGA